jgi:hypothetical protein
VAKDSGKKQAEDLELSPDKADTVKGGLLPTEPGGGNTRGLAVHKGKHGKKTVPSPSGGMTHQ